MTKKLYLHAFALNPNLASGEVWIGPLDGFGITHETVRAGDEETQDYTEILVQSEGLWYLYGNVAIDGKPGYSHAFADPRLGRFTDIYSEYADPDSVATYAKVEGTTVLTMQELLARPYVSQHEAAEIEAAEAAFIAMRHEADAAEEARIHAPKPRLVPITSFDNLIARLKAKGSRTIDARLILGGGVAYSAKTITLAEDDVTFEVFHGIDGTFEELTLPELMASHIGVGITNGALFEEVIG